MVLSLRITRSCRWPRLSIVASLILVLLAFPCGPLGVSLGLEIGQSFAADTLGAFGAGQDDAECTHGAEKNDHSCCSECTSWLLARSDQFGTVVLSSAGGDLTMAASVRLHPDYTVPDLELRLTGPPTHSLDGTKLYLKTQRFRI
jgi:hypothetical protein